MAKQNTENPEESIEKFLLELKLKLRESFDSEQNIIAQSGLAKNLTLFGICLVLIVAKYRFGDGSGEIPNGLMWALFAFGSGLIFGLISYSFYLVYKYKQVHRVDDVRNAAMEEKAQKSKDLFKATPLLWGGLSLPYICLAIGIGFLTWAILTQEWPQTMVTLS